MRGRERKERERERVGARYGKRRVERTEWKKRQNWKQEVKRMF